MTGEFWFWIGPLSDEISCTIMIPQKSNSCKFTFTADGIHPTSWGSLCWGARVLMILNRWSEAISTRWRTKTLSFHHGPGIHSENNRARLNIMWCRWRTWGNLTFSFRRLTCTHTTKLRLVRLTRDIVKFRLPESLVFLRPLPWSPDRPWGERQSPLRTQVARLG